MEIAAGRAQSNGVCICVCVEIKCNHFALTILRSLFTLHHRQLIISTETAAAAATTPKRLPDSFVSNIHCCNDNKHQKNGELKLKEKIGDKKQQQQ